MKSIDDRPNSILVVVAHPDDADFICGGTIALWAEQGSEINLLVCTDGSVGGHDENLTAQELEETRKQEQREAADLLGIKNVHHLSFPDGGLEANRDLKLQVTQKIRELQPDLVITFDPTFFYSSELNYVNHADHRAVGEATFDCVYPLARDKRSFPELALEPHKVKILLMFNPSNASCFVDIEAKTDSKCQALLSHASQFKDEAAIKAMVERFAKYDGAKAGCNSAECFVRLDLPA